MDKAELETTPILAVRWDERGLAQAVATDARTGALLMVAYQCSGAGADNRYRRGALLVAFPAGGLALGRHLRQRADGGRTAGGLRSVGDLDEGGAGRACLTYGGCKLLFPP